MIINKFDKRIAFSPFSEPSSSFYTPRSSSSKSSFSKSDLPMHFRSSSSDSSYAQLKNEIIGSAKEILSFFKNEGRVNQNLDPKNTSKKNTIKEHLNPQTIIRQIKNSGYLGFLKQEFIKLLKVLPDNEKEDYTFRFNNAVKGNARKLENQSEEIRESRLGKSPFTLIKISPVKFSSPSQRGASPAAEELLSPSQRGAPPTAKKLSFPSQPREYTPEKFSSPSQREVSPAAKFSSPSKPGTSPGMRNVIDVQLSPISKVLVNSK